MNQKAMPVGRQRFSQLILIIIIGAVVAIAGGSFWYYQQSAETKTLTVFVHERTNNPEDLKEITIANIIVRMSDGDLTLNPIVDDTSSIIARLNNALTEIKNRPSLKLPDENRTIIDGKDALVMTEIDVLKTNPEYIYAVKYTLWEEFSFRTKIEKEPDSGSAPQNGGIFWKSVVQGDEIRDDRDPAIVCKKLQIEQGLNNCNIIISKKSQNNEECADGMSVAGCFACEFDCR